MPRRQLLKRKHLVVSSQKRRVVKRRAVKTRAGNGRLPSTFHFLLDILKAFLIIILFSKRNHSLPKSFFLNINATADVPIKVADQYNHKSPTDPDKSAGARDRAGFIEAPEMRAKKNMSRPTMPPIAMPLNPRSPFVWI